jgi:hypothetical protein
MTDGMQDRFDNKIPELNDLKNELPEDKWISEVDISKYQALIPLPYFYSGSENVWIWTESDVIADAFIVSQKTGIPMLSMILSRTSLEQSYKNIALIKEPYRPLEILKAMPSKKPFLVIAREKDLKEDDARLFSHCKKITAGPKFGVYELSYETLEGLSKEMAGNAETELGVLQHKTDKGLPERLWEHNGMLSTDSLLTFAYKGYDETIGTSPKEGKGCYENLYRDFNSLYYDTIPNWKDVEYTYSFWMDDFTTDLYPRGVIEVAYLNEDGTAYGSDFSRLDLRMRLVDGKWGLIEGSFHLKSARDKVKITVWTDTYLDPDIKFRADELLIRPTATRVYKNTEPGRITVNNRTYLVK